MGLLDELRGISPLDPDLQNGMALGLLEQAQHAVKKVIRVFADPAEVVVLFVNFHDEARTAWLSTNQDDDSVAVHVAQGFK